MINFSDIFQMIWNLNKHRVFVKIKNKKKETKKEHKKSIDIDELFIE